ncbi:MAG TPA: flagellar hook-length control protein FliK [Noviherbaspirillum sp.]|uniref:flagellar hook-length control protein FliK n=1 Tax=Noviherbaspirillum sp. TaxID=1926288 RepID=UPI002B46D743|nr:flagellar hook-length control protein FliK [Noviherbaspirillum sp.]HJV88498.1 flagellar hook-length control protein FliK [Noviherbaspirillum sp.]
MQTSQVTNPVNMLTNPAPPTKQPESGSSSQPFGQVLSREVANRHEAATAPARSDSGSGNTAAAANASKSDPKQANDAKATDDDSTAADAAAADESANATTLPDEMLALVANFAQMAKPAAKADGKVAGSAKDVAAATDSAPALATVAAAGTQGAASSIDAMMSGQATDAAQRLATIDKPGSAKHDTSLSSVTDKAGHTRARPEHGAAKAGDHASIPAATETAGSGKDAVRGTTAATAAAAAADFKSEMKESLATITNGIQQIQAAAVQPPQPVAIQAAEQLSPRVGTPAWDQALGQKIVWMVAGDQQSASLTLNPPDLGPLQVVLNVTNSQADATFIAAQPEVRQALEAAMPKLRDMLGEAGIQLGQATVNSGSANQQNTPGQHHAQSSHHIDQADTRGDTAVRTSRVQPAVSRQGMVDTFV